ncbi:hypothetical protein Z043_103526 [Scleropages formosus]|uniref:Uncharacterized protein n=1 Tax=Scleropages formosus TaxID=113540 RepID=A0A0P7Z8M1_SCLFO|nr:hypothetical protein Z043_103526 [Scleropages formosus]
MSKRSCPWSDGTPQRKTCVKEGTVSGEAQRMAVYGESAFSPDCFSMTASSLVVVVRRVPERSSSPGSSDAECQPST